MLNTIRVIVVVLGGISLLLIAMDAYSFAGFQLKHNKLKLVIYMSFIACSIFFAIDGFLIWFYSR